MALVGGSAYQIVPSSAIKGSCKYGFGSGFFIRSVASRASRASELMVTPALSACFSDFLIDGAGGKFVRSYST